MNEEIEYAEMLEIPVSTINVVRNKKGKNKRKSQPPFYPNEPKTPDLKDSVIAQVNDKLFENGAPKITADADLFAEGVNSNGDVRFEDYPERIDTIRLYNENERPFYDDMPEDFSQNAATDNVQPYPPTSKSEKKLRRVLGVEFALACALCGGIFLTNVFVPNSAVNTFFRSLSSTPATEAPADTRVYSDFTLNGVVSDFTDVEMTLSQTGVLSFQKECCVYPAVDGTVREVLLTDNGTYSVKIGHSDTFTGVIDGLSQVYYAVGDEVKSNVPVGYSDGETQVQVTMYSNEELLSCFQVTEENNLVWVTQG
ncbi:MAG: M23 family metallopeptidase [Clostridiales bacterium]|nr:M23 family metallopeptidase [Clostridiales bacterium]